MLNDDNKKSFKKMLKGNALYFALGLCLLAAGVVGISAAGNNLNPSVTPEYTTSAEKVTKGEVNITESVSDFFVEIDIDEFTTKEIATEETVTEELSTAAVFENASPAVEETSEVKEIFFSSPLAYSIGKDYSMGIPVFSETMKDYRTHNGVDFKGVKGENVNTIAEGTVVSVEKDAVWGNTVTIDHGNGITSYVSGLADEALITVGSTVGSGTVIGIVGEIPVESGDDSHIHLEIRENGELRDPLEVLGLSGE